MSRRRSPRRRGPDGPDTRSLLVLSVLTVIALGLFVVPSLLPDESELCVRGEIAPSSSTIEGDPVEVVAAATEASVSCADVVVVADPARHDIAAAAQWALANDAVVLLGSPDRSDVLARALSRLQTETVWWPGNPGDFDGALSLDGRAIGSIELPSPADPLPEVAPRDASVVWLLPDATSDVQRALTPVALASGAVFAEIDADADVYQPPDGATADTPVAHLGTLDPSDAWLLRGLLQGITLPNGRRSYFPESRIVASYGTPGIPALGVLGEASGPEDALADLQPYLASYAADGKEVIPGFEIIVTVASREAGPDGDYSAEIEIDTIRPWVDAAAELGVVVIIDLQPGRTDFLTQARIYEELLIEPHVGLALDPEWRLGPDQRHLEQIGTVDGTEVNTVVDYLAELVREHDLPQKILVLHQFRLSMITNRDVIESTPELAVVLHVDGQGRIEEKFETYAALTTDDNDGGLWWGWKNFFNEDSPFPDSGTVLGVDPLPLMVTFQ